MKGDLQALEALKATLIAVNSGTYKPAICRCKSITEIISQGQRIMDTLEARRSPLFKNWQDNDYERYVKVDKIYHRYCQNIHKDFKSKTGVSMLEDSKRSGMTLEELNGEKYPQSIYAV